jgi:uncharacterized membrane protein
MRTIVALGALAVGLYCIGYALSNPELTMTQLFLKLWPLYIVMALANAGLSITK